jgi:hypothetical protein
MKGKGLFGATFLAARKGALYTEIHGS